MRHTLILAFFSVLVAAQPSEAALVSWKAISPDLPVAPPPGYVVNDILIDFEGRLAEQQMILELTQGDIYQDPLGATINASFVLAAVSPGVYSDTFVTMGGYGFGGHSENVLSTGASSVFPESDGVSNFDESGLDIAWTPRFPIDDQTDFMIARVTLSEDAIGMIRLFSSSGGVGTAIDSSFHCGRIGDPCVPEPTAALLLALGCLGPLMNRRAFVTREGLFA